MNHGMFLHYNLCVLLFGNLTKYFIFYQLQIEPKKHIRQQLDIVLAVDALDD